MAYTPPTGNSITIELGGAYTPPAGNALILDFAPIQYAQAVSFSDFAAASPTVTSQFNLALDGFDSAAFGVALVSGPSLLQPAGVAEFAAGDATVSNVSALSPSGWDGFADGDAFISNAVRTLAASGFDSSAVGSAAAVRNAREFVRGLGLLSETFGTAAVDNAIRTLFPVPTSGFAAGTPWISFGTRTVEPPSVLGAAVGRPGVGRHQALPLDGFESTLFGETVVRDNSQTLVGIGFAGEAVGTAELSRSPRVLGVASTWGANPGIDDQWGAALVYNATQFLGPYNDDTQPMGGVFGQWLEVYNRNRVVGVYGFNSSRYGNGASLSLGPVIDPAGADLTEFGAAFVSHAVRTVTANEPVEGGVSPWGAVYNAAAVLAPASVVGGEDFGQAALANTRRTFDRIGGLDSFAAGTAFVAYAVRTLAVQWPPEGFAVPDPVVEFKDRVLAPAGIDEPDMRWGATTVFSHVNRVSPRYRHDSDVFGAASLRNLTPALQPASFDQGEIGHAAVGLYTRTLSPPGLEQTGWGYAEVRDRASRVRAGNIGAPVLPWGHAVLHDPAEYPFQQTLEAQGMEAFSYGTPVVASSTQEIHPDGLAGSVSSPTVVYQGINLQNRGIYLPADQQYGVPTVLAWQLIAPEGWESVGIGEALLSPAVIEHKAGPVGFVSEPSVTLKHRTVLTRHDTGATDAYGEPTVSNAKQYVRPAGFAAFKRGYPKVGGPHNLEPVGVESGEAFGAATLSIPDTGPHTLAAQGFEAAQFGVQTVQLFNRAIPVGGLAGEVGVPRVHPPEPLLLDGFEAGSFGTAWVSHKVRGLDLEGFDAFLSGPAQFNLHMTVKRGQPLFPKGFKGTEWGGGRVSHLVQKAAVSAIISERVGGATLTRKTQIIKPFPPSTIVVTVGRVSITRG